MSNTSSVTPYDDASSSSASNSAGLAAAAAVACVAGAITLAWWLTEETAEDRTAVERLKTERRREILGRQEQSSTPLSSTQRESLVITTVGLQLRNPETLVRTTERLGYQVESLAGVSSLLAKRPQILLSRASGERLAVAHNDSGRLVVHTAGDRRRV